MEVAGLVLGSFVIIDIAEKAAAIAKVISEIKSCPKDIAELLFQLANEAQKLEAWATEAALYAEAETGAPHDVEELQETIKKAVSTAVARILLALDEARNITDKYGITEILDQTSSMNSDTPTDIINLSINANRKSTLTGARARQKIIENSLNATKSRKKTRMVFKPWGTSDKEELSALVERLKYWNGELWVLLSRRRRLALDFQVSCQILAVTDDLSTLETVRQSAEISSNLVAGAGLAEANLRIEQDETTASQQIIEWGRFMWSDTRSSRRQLAKMRIFGNPDPRGDIQAAVPALINWLDYSTFTTDQQTIALERVAKLSKFLGVTSKPSGLCTLNARGFVKDSVHKRFGLVFEVPAVPDRQATTDATVISLLDLLVGKSGGSGGEAVQKAVPYPRPTLLQRFQLARRLAIAFMELHNARWLHKGFNSDCVVFFGSNLSAAVPGSIFDQPYVTGFEFSRPAGPENVSLPTIMAIGGELYQHPWLLREKKPALSTSQVVPGDLAVIESTGVQTLVDDTHHVRFRPAFDLYSLGVVLLEIALWQPARNLRKPDSTAQEFAERLQKTARANLPHIMGETYTRVVTTCLGTEFRLYDQYDKDEEEERKSISRELQRIYWEIVRPLEECHCRK